MYAKKLLSFYSGGNNACNSYFCANHTFVKDSQRLCDLKPLSKEDTSCEPLHGFAAHMVHYIEIRIQKCMHSFWTKSNSILSDSSSKIVIRFSPFQSLCFIIVRYNHLNPEIVCTTQVFAREFKRSFSNSPT